MIRACGCFRNFALLASLCAMNLPGKTIELELPRGKRQDFSRRVRKMRSLAGAARCTNRGRSREVQSGLVTSARKRVSRTSRSIKRAVIVGLISRAKTEAIPRRVNSRLRKREFHDRAYRRAGLDSREIARDGIARNSASCLADADDAGPEAQPPPLAVYLTMRARAGLGETMIARNAHKLRSTSAARTRRSERVNGVSRAQDGAFRRSGESCPRST